MAETAAKTTTPRRPRQRATTAGKAATAPAKPRRPAPKKAAQVEASFTFDLAPVGDTKNFSLFDQGTDVNGNKTGCVGKYYAPLGTTAVQVTITGPSDVVEELVAEAVADE